MENLIKFCQLLIQRWKSVTDEKATTIALGIMQVVSGLPTLLNALQAIAFAIHKGEIVSIGYWNSLRLRLLNVAFSAVVRNVHSTGVTMFEQPGIGMMLKQAGKSAELLSDLSEEAIHDGYLDQLNLFGPEIYRKVKELIESGGLTDDKIHLLSWWTDATRLIKEGFVVMSTEDGLTLVKKERLPMEPKAKKPTVDQTRQVATLLATVVSRVKEHNQYLIDFFISGTGALPQDVLSAITSDNKELLSYLNKETNGIASRFCELWLGGAAEATSVLTRVLGYSSTDQDGLTRMLRNICRAAHDVSLENKYGTKLMFHIGTLQNGVECINIYREGSWSILVTSECARLRNTVVTDESFRMAKEQPSIVCAYAGKFLTVMPPVVAYEQPKKDSDSFEQRSALARVMNLVSLHKVYVTPVVNHTKNQTSTTWLKFFRLPNLCLFTRVDHISAQLVTGKINRTLLWQELDNIIVVANVLSRAQRSNTGSLVEESVLLTKGLCYSGRAGARITNLFPRITRNGLSIPGDLLKLSGMMYGELKNRRMPHGTSNAIVADPRIGVDDVIPPNYMRSHILKRMTEFVKVSKMPSFITFELMVRALRGDNCTHLHPITILLAGGDCDGDMVNMLAMLTRALCLAPSEQGGSFVQNYAFEDIKVAIPKYVPKPKYMEVLMGLIYGKGLLGVGVKFWRQTLQAVKELNPFKVEYCRAAFNKYNQQIAKLMLRYGYTDFVVDGVASFERFLADYPKHPGGPSDYLSNQVATMLFEMIMPKAQLSKEATDLLVSLGISPESMRTLDGQLNVMDRVQYDPIETLNIFLAVDDKLMKRWMPRVVMAFLAMHTLCSSKGMTLQELIAAAPAGRKFHQKPGDWKSGMWNVIQLIKKGAKAIGTDVIKCKPHDAVSFTMPEEDEESNNKFSKKNCNDQLQFIEFIKDSASESICKTNRKNGFTEVPTLLALRLFVKYLQHVDNLSIEIHEYQNDNDEWLYEIREIDENGKPTGMVYAMDIARYISLKPGEELADLYYMDVLCTKCNAIYGHCEHVHCKTCKSPVGHCGHTDPSQITFKTIDGHFDPRKAIAWLLTRKDTGDNGYSKGNDTILAIIREGITSYGSNASSVGQVFNRYMRRFTRRLAYKPGGNLTPELRKWAKDNKHNLDMVAVEWPVDPMLLAKAKNSVYAEVESALNFSMSIAKRHRLCATATSNSKPGRWMRHMASEDLFPAFIHLMDVGYGYMNAKRHPVAIKFEQMAYLLYGGNKMPVVWDNVPDEVIPTVLTPWIAYLSHPWNRCDQFAVTKELLDSFAVLREKKLVVKSGFVVCVGEDLTFELKPTRRGSFSKKLVVDPSGLFAPVFIEEVEESEWNVELDGEFELTPEGYVAMEDSTINVFTATKGCTGMKFVDLYGGKGLAVEMHDVGKFTAVLGGKAIDMDGLLSPDRFCADKMQCGSAPIAAIWAQVRYLMLLNGNIKEGASLRIDRSIKQEDMLEKALTALYMESCKLQTKTVELQDKLVKVYNAYQDAKTQDEKVAALWEMAFVPLYHSIGGVTKYVGDVMINQHATSVQQIFPQETSTIPTGNGDERLIKFDSTGDAVLNYIPNDSTAGTSLREDYAFMTISMCQELAEEMYSAAESFKYDKAKVYAFEVFASCALQQDVVAFPELGAIPFPNVLNSKGLDMAGESEDLQLMDEDNDVCIVNIDD